MREYPIAVGNGGGALTLDVQLFQNGSINQAQAAFIAAAWQGL